MSEASNAHKTLAEALAAFQAEKVHFTKSKTARTGSYSYKYADLGEINPIVNPLLAKHGLSWSSKPQLNESGDLVLTYVLRHVSGEEDAGEIPLGVARGCKPQELGSSITYMRRYAKTAQLDIAADEDDDAQTAQGSTAKDESTARRPTAAPVQPTPRLASAEQRGLIFARAAEKHLSPPTLANVVLAASGADPKLWETNKEAEDWLKRALDRLPAKTVDGILAEIEKAPS